MLPYEMMAGGSFTLVNKLKPFDLNLISQNPPDHIVVRNRTGWGKAAQSTGIIQFEWFRGMAQGTSQGLSQTTATGALTATVNTAAGVASDGISTYDTANPPSFAPLAATTVTAANPAVVSMVETGTIAVGDFVRMINVVGMEQISGMVFQVLAVTNDTSITLDLDASGFAAPGTAASVRKLIPSRFYPRYGIITGITQANPCVVSVTTDSDFTIGEEVSFRIPPSTSSPAFSTMSQLNNLKGVVTAVTPSTASTQSTVTVNIDTSGFTAFVLPTSAQAAAGSTGGIVSLIVPAGSGVIPNQNPPGMNILDAFDNRNTRVIHIGASLFAAANNLDIFDWVAYKYSQYNGQ